MQKLIFASDNLSSKSFSQTIQFNSIFVSYFYLNSFELKLYQFLFLIANNNKEFMLSIKGFFHWKKNI
tara:strand:+ start:171 stop:374 length:204 start_codon:yes stop_codon:yes gene_type:complete